MPRGKKTLSLQDRQRVFDLASRGFTAQQIAQRMGITLAVAQRAMAKGLMRCARCGRMIDRGELCAVCTLTAKAPLGERLRAFRASAGFSQERFAAHIDVSIGRVRDWENGRKQPTEHEFETLAEALGITVQQLTGVAEPPKGD